jgi:hypothetical protein
MTVVYLSDRRGPASEPRDGVCACGGRWFRPLLVDGAGATRAGAVVLDENGDVCGYAGEMHCIDCGKHFKP